MKEAIGITIAALFGVIVGIAFNFADRIAEDRDEALVSELTEMRVMREWELEQEKQKQ
jgi:predicted outer membrane lipoprotein